MNGEVVCNSHSITMIDHTKMLFVHDEKKINKETQFSPHSQENEPKESRRPKPFSMAAKDLSSDLTERSNCSSQRQHDVLSCTHPPSAVTALSHNLFYTNNNNNNRTPQGKHPKRGVYKKERRSTLKSASHNRKVTDYYPIRRSSRKSKTELQCEQKQLIDDLIIKGIERGMEVQQIEGKGRGVFATRSFQKGEYVVEYHGDLLQRTDAKKREAEYAQNPATGCYMYYFQYLCKTYCVDATKETGRMGEELLYDYGDRSKASIAAHPWLKE
ncbi:N-lysine methyltransferase KMT5A-A isoform X2 [Eucyclogobius newberryi]|uniref:N-lysine methyltransferase KMT5A-A isoform X2 n=1 Tax=Eucyclogobius newberryi TaxID=166745 RepID=UPI003B58F9E7